MPTFKNETNRPIDHWAILQKPDCPPERILVRFAPGEERALGFLVPYEKLGLTLIDANYPVVPDTILVSGTFSFPAGLERKFNIESCDTYDLTVIVQTGAVKVFFWNSNSAVEVRSDTNIPFNFKTTVDWEYSPYIRREEYRKFLELISKPSDTHENVYDGEFPYTPETDYTETLEGGNPNTQTWNVTGGGDP